MNLPSEFVSAEDFEEALSYMSSYGRGLWEESPPRRFRIDVEAATDLHMQLDPEYLDDRAMCSADTYALLAAGLVEVTDGD